MDIVPHCLIGEKSAFLTNLAHNPHLKYNLVSERRGGREPFCLLDGITVETRRLEPFDGLRAGRDRQGQ